jgi:hypothetical protein
VRRSFFLSLLISFRYSCACLVKGPVVDAVGASSRHRKVSSSSRTYIQVTSFAEYKLKYPGAASLVDQSRVCRNTLIASFTSSVRPPEEGRAALFSRGNPPIFECSSGLGTWIEDPIPFCCLRNFALPF